MFKDNLKHSAGVEEPKSQDPRLAELERRAADAREKRSAAQEAHEHVMGLVSSLPDRIEQARKTLAEVGAAFYSGQATEGEVSAVAREIEDMERELQICKLSSPLLRETLKERELENTAAVIAFRKASKPCPFEAKRAEFLERGKPLSSIEGRDLRRLASAVGKKRSEVDVLERDLDDMAKHRKAVNER